MVKASRISSWRSHELLSEAGECLGARDTAAPSQQPDPPPVFEEGHTKFPSVQEENWEVVSAPAAVPTVPVQLVLQSEEVWKWELILQTQTFLGFTSQEAVNIMMWWIGWSRYVQGDFWDTMIHKIRDIRWFFYFWHFEYVLIQASTSDCAEQSACMSVPGRCTELNSLVTVLGGTLKWEGMRGMRKNPYNETENCFPLCFWPSWAATCTSESRKAPLWSLSRGEAVFLGGLFPRL